MSRRVRYALAALLLVAVFFAFIHFFSARDIAIDLITRIRAYGAIAPVVYSCVYLIAAVAGFPRTLLTIVAGIVFEPVVAFVVVMVSIMAVFMCTFLIARYFAADWVTSRLEKIPVAKRLMSAVEQHGFRMLVLMRLNPFVPGIVNGYGFGMTSIKPLPYFVASVVGQLPLILIYVYLGWAGGEAILHAGAEAETMRYGTLLFGVTLSLLMLIAIAWYGRRMIDSAGTDMPQSPDVR